MENGPAFGVYLSHDGADNQDFIDLNFSFKSRLDSSTNLQKLK